MARIAKARKRFQRDKPSLERLIAEGDVEGAVRWGDLLALREIFRKLRAIREGRGVSLSQAAEASGINKAALSRLENGVNANPTLQTLLRYAGAIGAELGFSVKVRKK
jgi:DNA-binding XRE family transcriptional regulator